MIRIPKSREALNDFIVAGAFIAMSVLLPESVLSKGFEAHMSGIAFGLGLGWFVKSFIDYTKGVKREETA